MRTAIFAAVLTVTLAGAATAQSSKPLDTAPASSAPFETRESWCERYAAWFVGETPAQRPPPADQRPTQRLENEITYCKPDPQRYERETRAEAAQLRARAAEG